MNVLGVERAVNLMNMTDGLRGWDDNPSQFLDLTIDGSSLREMFNGPDDLTLLTTDSFDNASRTESLKRLLGMQVAAPDFTPRFHRTRLEQWLRMRGTPYAPWATAFEDGRIGLLFCRCGDLDCGTLSMHLEVHDDSVVWRDIGWQTTYEPSTRPEREGALVTARFARGPYERLLLDLLDWDWSDGPPAVA